MTNRQRFFAVMASEPTDRPPFFPDVTNWYAARRTPPGRPRRHGSGAFIPDDDPIHQVTGDMPPQFADMTFLDLYKHFDWGLPIHVYNWFETQYDGVERTVADDGRHRVTRIRCPKGELEKIDTLADDGSWGPTTHFVKDLSDLAIMQYAVEHSCFVPRYERVRAVLAAIGEQGVIDITLMRSPFGKLVHEYMGFEQVIYALQDSPQTILDFMDFQEQYDLRLAQLAADAPARIVILSDHADENLIAPPYYLRYCIPHYQKLCSILHQAGKIVSTHLDGNFKGYFPLLGLTGFDLLDGCTPAPMMNYEPEELADALPADMRAYCGVPATLFTQNVDDRVILDFGRRILDALAGRVILNIGDILPTNADIFQMIRLGEMAAEYRPVAHTR